MRISSFKFQKKFGDGALLTSSMQTKYCHRNSSKKSIDCKFLSETILTLYQADTEKLKLNMLSFFMFHFTRMEQKHLIILIKIFFPIIYSGRN